jgi:ribosomal protein S18 acetylase RimI-like enzyme
VAAPVYVTIDRVGPEHADGVHALYREAWWAVERSREAVAAMLGRTPVTTGLLETGSGRLVGFARALTDQTFVGLVLDVIVAADLRRRGLGHRLMSELLARPELTGLDYVELTCQPELIAFYRRLGFTEHVGRSTLMRRSANPRLAGDAG